MTSCIPLTAKFNRKMPLTRKTYWPCQLKFDVIPSSAELHFIGWILAKSCPKDTGTSRLQFWIIWWVLWAAIVGNFLLTFPPLWQVWLHAPDVCLPEDAVVSCTFYFKVFLSCLQKILCYCLSAGCCFLTSSNPAFAYQITVCG